MMASTLIWIISLLSLAQIGWAQEAAISVEYRDKPPYTYTKEGKPAGFLMERVINILQRAQVAAVYSETPVKRIMKDLQDNKQPVCSPGWYKIPEREVFARFSLPIHQDKPHIVVANIQAADKLRTMKTFKKLLTNPDYRLGKVSGVSYGPELDMMISSTPQTVMDSTVTPDVLARMVAQHRADYMLMDVEDYNYLSQAKLIDSNKIAVLKYPDIPAGLKRYILCSQSVSPAIMQRIDNAIQAMLPNL